MWRFFCVDKSSAFDTGHSANGFKLLTFGEADRQELALDAGRATSQTAGLCLVPGSKQRLWSTL
jgi:hypothetical protein